MPFFPGVTCAMDLSDNQLTLLEFIGIYESIDEIDPRDKPDQETIEDDGKFDMWIKNYARRKEEEIRTGGKGKKADHHKTVVRYDGFEEEGLDDGDDDY